MSDIVLWILGFASGGILGALFGFFAGQRAMIRRYQEIERDLIEIQQQEMQELIASQEGTTSQNKEYIH